MTIEISNHIKEIERVLGILNEYCNQYPMNVYDRKKVSIVVDEILSNIITYGYDDSLQHSIIIEFESYPDAFRMEFTDDGRFFDPIHFIDQQQESFRIDENKIGGLGLRLVHRLMNQMSYTRSEDKNKLKLSLYYAKIILDI